jgi:hypothetical protein
MTDEEVYAFVIRKLTVIKRVWRKHEFDWTMKSEQFESRVQAVAQRNVGLVFPVICE